MLTPDSTSWTLSVSVSALLEVLMRTGILQRVELWVAAKVAARYGYQWTARVAQIDALELLYLHSLGGTSYVGTTMALCIGCTRTVTFGDPAAILWLDVSPTWWRVLAAQFAIGAVANAIVWSAERFHETRGLELFALSTFFGIGHPLHNPALRNFRWQGYAFAFGIGSAFTYVLFIAFLGPAFVTGTCRDFVRTDATGNWVAQVHALVGCAGLSASLNATS
jgi:hypothetical protein